MEELWKPVKGFESLYLISNKGRLKKCSFVDKRGVYHPRHLVSTTNSKGWYLTIILNNGIKKVTERIHRMVYKAFVGEIPNGCDVHHIDGNRQNNNVENLQLLTEHEHMHLHAIDPATYRAMNEYNFKRRRRVSQYTLDGTFIKTYSCAHEASIATGVCERNISQVSNHTPFSPNHYRKQAGGFIWKLNDPSH